MNESLSEREISATIAYSILAFFNLKKTKLESFTLFLCPIQVESESWTLFSLKVIASLMVLKVITLCNVSLFFPSAGAISVCAAALC